MKRLDGDAAELKEADGSAFKVRRLVVPFVMKEIDEKTGAFEGYASVFGNVDLDGDIILAGAFKASIKEQRGEVPLFYRHTDPIGTAQVEEDAKGLKTLGFPIMEDVPEAKKAMALVRARSVKGMSVAILPRVATRDSTTGIRTIKRAELLEVSLVPFGANPEARVTSVKSLSELTSAELLIAALIEGRPFDEKSARELALLRFPGVSSDTDSVSVKDALDAIKKLTEEMKP